MYYTTKEVEEKMSNPLPDGSILLMDFASKGLSWVENLYQKFEESYNAAGEHIKKIYDEVKNEFQSLPNEFLQDEFSDKSLEQDATTGISHKPGVEIGKSTFCEKLACDSVDPVVCSVEDLSLLTLSNEPQVCSQKEAYGRGNNKTSPTEDEGCNCSDAEENWMELEGKSAVGSSSESLLGQIISHDEENEKSLQNNAVESDCTYKICKVITEDSILVTPSDGSQVLGRKNLCDEEDTDSRPTESRGSVCSYDAVENDKKVSESVTSLADVTSSLQLAEAVPLASHLISPNHGHSSIASSFTSSKEVDGICTFQEALLSLGPSRNGNQQQIEPNKLEVSVRSLESGGFKREDSSSSFHVSQAYTETEEFEDVKLDDICDDAEKREIALILSRRSMSFKKKLKDALISKVRSSKSYNRPRVWYAGDDFGMQNGIPALSVPSGDLQRKNLPIQDFLESEWEIL